ncbi:hypothetical protein [Nitrobacter hamburgensis]|nr:hypothetical protein [Nitrobacter hamburgensis]
MSQFDGAVKEIDTRIAWVLAHREMSCWLKEALKSALNRDPFDILNDLEILNHLLRARSDALIGQSLGERSGGGDDSSSGPTI